MATPDEARFVQEQLGYTFHDPGILLLALTAAGKGGTEDEPEKRGNSRLAHLGNYLVQFLLAWVGFSEDRSRADATTLRTQLSSTEHCARVAEKAALDRCLKYDMRSGSKSAVVLRKALNAVIAAVFVDSHDFDQVLEVALKLGLFGHDKFGIDPRLLSRDQTGVMQRFYNATRPAAVQPVEGAFPGQETRLIPIEQMNLPPAPSNLLNLHRVQSPFTDMQYSPMEWFDNFFDHTQAPPGMDTAPNSTGTLPGFTPRPEFPEQEEELAASATKRPRVALREEKTQSAGDNAPIRVTAWLDEYLAEERQKCIAHNIAPPDKTFFTEQIETELRALGKKHANTSILIHILVASPYAFASLCELVSSFQAADDFRLWQVESTVTAQARFNIIRNLDSKIAAYVILRRYHILQLFEDSVPANSRALTNTNFVNAGLNDFQQTRRPGNPERIAKSEVTYEMIRAICPGIDPSSPEYRSTHRAISRLQMLGRRYHNLTSRFGKGILSLLPPGGLGKPLDMGISDNMILALPEGTFNKLLDILDRTQGAFLRSSSDAAACIIEPLIYSAPHGTARRHLEICKVEDIFQHPKGSKELFDVLHQVQLRPE
ncbi:hypothetical protein BJX61DRAFT_529501 [Aspergillus egyptiacus]|nr:hypothetical protein BJX61DRAFT_529501 [Aspergillus egyptiacus]